MSSPTQQLELGGVSGERREEESGLFVGRVNNPLVDELIDETTSSTRSGVSDAYKESFKRARESARWESPTAVRRVSMFQAVGIKTLIFIIFLLLAGIVCLITGLVFFLSGPSATGEEGSEKRGVDLLIVSAIMLLPGLWASHKCYRGDYHLLNLG